MDDLLFLIISFLENMLMVFFLFFLGLELLHVPWFLGDSPLASAGLSIGYTLNANPWHSKIQNMLLEIDGKITKPSIKIDGQI